MISTLVASGIFVAAVMLTGMIRFVSLRNRILDIPQERSAHSVPTPSSGGLAIVLPVSIVVFAGFSDGMLSSAVFMAFLGALLVAGIGLYDDLTELKVGTRISLQFVAAGWSLYWLGGVAPIPVAGWELQQPWILYLLALFALVWLLNLFNFMDGIDGLAASELIFVNAVSLLFVINTDADAVGMLSLSLAAAAAGFLVWNWPPARIFMGDVGSGFSGFMLGLLALFSMQAGVMTVWTWLILLGVFVCDATFTLVRRALAAERWYEGHASHAYQHAARKHKSHGKVTITVLVINCVWLAPLAYLSTIEQELGIFLSFVALSPLMFLAFRYQAGVQISS